MPEPDRVHHYLCSYCDRFFTAPPDSVDRTKMVRCPDCAMAFGSTYAQPWSDPNHNVLTDLAKVAADAPARHAALLLDGLSDLPVTVQS